MNKSPRIIIEGDNQGDPVWDAAFDAYSEWKEKEETNIRQAQERMKEHVLAAYKNMFGEQFEPKAHDHESVTLRSGHVMKYTYEMGMGRFQPLLSCPACGQEFAYPQGIYDLRTLFAVYNEVEGKPKEELATYHRDCPLRFQTNSDKVAQITDTLDELDTFSVGEVMAACVVQIVRATGNAWA